VQSLVRDAWTALVVGLEADAHLPVRRRLDSYGDSLVFTNRMINRAFVMGQGNSGAGATSSWGSVTSPFAGRGRVRRARRVPAHMPHMIDVGVVEAMEARFPTEFRETSRHRFRSSTDVQYAFAYFHFLMEGGAQGGIDTHAFWRSELDTDGDGVLNDNEFRTLAAVVAGGAPNARQMAECVASGCARALRPPQSPTFVASFRAGCGSAWCRRTRPSPR
jgi:hypothetical protein